MINLQFNSYCPFCQHKLHRMSDHLFKCRNENVIFQLDNSVSQHNTLTIQSVHSIIKNLTFDANFKHNFIHVYNLNTSNEMTYFVTPNVNSLQELHDLVIILPIFS